MVIGIDLDGVVFDSESVFRTYEEIYDIEELGGNNLIDRTEPKHQQRYNWTEEQTKVFRDKYYLEISKVSPLMAGFKTVYERLKNEGHTFVVITARGGWIPEMADDAIRIFEENNISFDKYYWHTSDKLNACLESKVDFMIDDDYKVIEHLSSNGIKTLYFRDTNLKKLEENEYIKEVNNWGDIYRYIKNR